MANKILPPVGYYPDPTKGRPIAGGFLYIGEVDKDSELFQKQVTILQENGSQVAVTQPIDLSPGGVPIYNGSTSISLFVDGDYSWKVLDKLGTQKYYIPDSTLTDADEIRVFATVADMVAANLVVGNTYTTQGYNTAGDGGGGVYFVSSSGTADGFVNFSVNTGAAFALLQIEDAINVLNAGATGDGSTDDTLAIQHVVDNYESIVIPPRVYAVSVIDFNDDNRHVSAYGAEFLATVSTPPVRSLFANRTVASKSLENVKILGLYANGDLTSTNCIVLERFTRRCAIRDCKFENATGTGVDVSESWSYEFTGNRAANNGGRGAQFTTATLSTDLDGNNAFTMFANWFSLNGDEGVVIENAQGGLFVGNTSEQNGSTNAIFAGKSLEIAGNYFEGFSASRVSGGGEETCVILGTADLPFILSEFDNYINGGSSGAFSFSGDGIGLLNVIECEIKSSFSLSTRYPYVFDETYTVIGNEIHTSFDAFLADLTPATVRNITDSVTGGVEVIKGTTSYNNFSNRSGDTQGIREDYQIKTNGVSGSIYETRVLIDSDVTFRHGKLSSADAVYKFIASSGAYYEFETASVIAPPMAETVRDALPVKKNGMVIFNITTGVYQGYKEVGATWVDFH